MNKNILIRVATCISLTLFMYISASYSISNDKKSDSINSVINKVQFTSCLIVDKK